jgi:competence protein ComEC
MASPTIYFWKKTPFIRILPPFSAGIIIQWYSQLTVFFWWILLLAAAVFMLLFFWMAFFQRFRLAWLNGIGINLLFISIGAILVWHNDIRHDQQWFGHSYNDSVSMVVLVNEPLIEKAKSFKASGNISYLLKDGKEKQVNGKIILYFMKDTVSSLPPGIDYGTQIILHKPLQEIKSSGNPGGFDYKRYSLFQGITHQVYLKPGEFEILPERKTTLFQRIFYPAGQTILKLLRANIRGEKELGLAEALLIGYKNDLDKTLVQSYSNTGVVHVIAISGLHIGLIYWLLVQLLRPLRKIKYARRLQPVLVITGLWGFSLLAGGQPSVLRSAVMFTCIVLGQSMARKASIYNTLAFSAFILLCYDPFWLWDAGFQLSYSAVLSILIFMKPVYNCLYIKNKLLDHIWKLNAVTLAAQILTLPVSIYHFHQFPVYFLLTNFIAVPLSSIIVLGEILVCTISFLPSIALFTGKILTWLIWLMNSYIEKIEQLPFALWDGLQINITQAIFFFGLIAGLGCWLMEKMKKGLLVALISLLVFSILRSYSFINADRQHKLIVYNIPRYRAIDFIEGRSYVFAGDSDLLTDDFTRNFHLKPSRIQHRLEPAAGVHDVNIGDQYASYRNRKIMMIDTSAFFSASDSKQDIDLLIISKNPKLYISRLSHTFNIKQVVFDGSVSAWKLIYWKKDCDSLHIPYHDVSEKGAFVMNLN